MHDEFARLVKQAAGDVPALDIARKCGVSLTYAYQIRKGQIPSRDKLVAFCDGLNIRGSKRAALFACAGYDDPRKRPVAINGLRPEVAEIARDLDLLPADELNIVRWLLERRPRLKAVAALSGVDPGVRYGAA